MTLEKLDTDQFVELYKTILPQDFNKEELKPIELLREHSLKDYTRCYCLFKNEKNRSISSILSYAIVSSSKMLDEKRYLLEYFSVNPNYRSHGIGSKMLKLLIKALQCTFYLEVEDPKFAGNEKEIEICKKRIKFYMKNGILKSTVSVKLYDGVYNIFYSTNQSESNDSKRISPIEIKDDLKVLYNNISHVPISKNTFLINN